ncbi:NUDIX hydrolase domain-like protein [Dipodascopsis tothii]|uniref:NUDIX hydrolase domain-like protein n=1 Tax=Dipodascopsis tothii TaxID=44089 RepID=UPI0034CDBF1D
MDPVVRSMIAREGREKQRYSASGARLVAGVVALNEDKTRVLVVTSTARKDRYVFPKGGYETDEPTPQDAALREAWEEAGVIGTITGGLGVIEDSRPAKTFQAAGGRVPPKAEYHFFEVAVSRLEDRFPECDRRTRAWVTFAEATGGLIDRPELIEALKRSSIRR